MTKTVATEILKELVEEGNECKEVLTALKLAIQYLETGSSSVFSSPVVMDIKDVASGKHLVPCISEESKKECMREFLISGNEVAKQASDIIEVRTKNLPSKLDIDETIAKYFEPTLEYLGYKVDFSGKGVTQNERV